MSPRLSPLPGGSVRPVARVHALGFLGAHSWLLAFALMLALACAPAAPASAGARVSSAPTVSCTEDVTACDSDRDGVADMVEEAVCGSATCATGTEDADNTGTPDVEEQRTSLKHGGVGGPVQFREAGMVRIVLAGPTVIDVPWWPAMVLVGGGLVVVGVVVVRRRSRARRAKRAGL